MGASCSLSENREARSLQHAVGFLWMVLLSDLKVELLVLGDLLVVIELSVFHRSNTPITNNLVTQ